MSWKPTTDLMTLRRMGKLIEELAELHEARHTPSLKDEVWKEIADVYAQLDETADRFRLERVPVVPGDVSEVDNAQAQLTNVASRVIIQGMDEPEPSTGILNRERLTYAIHRMYAVLDVVVDRVGYDRKAITDRREAKRKLMQDWEAMFAL